MNKMLKTALIMIPIGVAIIVGYLIAAMVVIRQANHKDDITNNTIILITVVESITMIVGIIGLVLSFIAKTRFAGFIISIVFGGFLVLIALFSILDLVSIIGVVGGIIAVVGGSLGLVGVIRRN